MLAPWLYTESSPNIGGQELQALCQMEALRDSGIPVELVCRPNSRIGDEARRRNLPRHTMALRSAGDVISVIELAKLMRRLRPRVVLSHSGHDAYLSGFAARMSRRRPVLLRVRTYHSSVKVWVYQKLFDHAVVPSEFMRRDLLKQGTLDASRVHVVYPGVDFLALERRSEEALDPDVSARIGAIGDGPIVVMAAMLRPEKGHDTLLRAWMRATAGIPSARCLLAGEGPLTPSIDRSIDELGLAGRVIRLGMVNNVAALLSRAHLVVVPSLYEPLGMTQIEALGLGVPVVASEVGGIPETIEHQRTGLLAPPGDVDGWTSALTRAFAQPTAMLAMAAKGREVVQGRFSMKATLERLSALAGSE